MASFLHVLVYGLDGSLQSAPERQTVETTLHIARNIHVATLECSGVSDALFISSSDWEMTVLAGLTSYLHEGVPQSFSLTLAIYPIL